MRRQGYGGRKEPIAAPLSCRVIGDIALTTLVLAGTLQDFMWFLMRVLQPEWQLRALASRGGGGNLDADLVQMTRVDGWGNLEAGLFGLITIGLRIRAFRQESQFDGNSYLLLFAVTAIGKIGVLATVAFPSDVSPIASMSIDSYVLLARAIGAFIGTVLSYFTFF